MWRVGIRRGQKLYAWSLTRKLGLDGRSGTSLASGVRGILEYREKYPSMNG